MILGNSKRKLYWHELSVIRHMCTNLRSTDFRRRKLRCYLRNSTICWYDSRLNIGAAPSPDWNCQWGPSGARIAYTYIEGKRGSKRELRRPPHQPSVRWQSIFCRCSQSLEQTSRLLPVQRTLSNVAWGSGFSKGPTTNIETTIITIILSKFLLLSLSSSLSLSLSSLLCSPFDVMRHRSLHVL